MARKKELTKEDRIKKEVRRLKRIYKDLEGKKKQVADGLIQEAAFMQATLEELRRMIDEQGPVDSMPQGEYSILREHPAVRTYNTMIQRYTTVVKQLADLLPREEPKEKDDGFESFVMERD
ncbi:hypothetical protein [Paludifilum halophilum]|uniref:Uncharacterized protein n=1 Tax=Paludifilum halophilum TaxID=1642702 RepID=A0A235B1B7_9BACL|nr:hypothetical protein [Paludifilum halophilum]OYD06096.1 hypothetical protein CHM34_18100 [Paludifilum halophilum]